MRNLTPKCDVIVHNHGSIYLFDPLSEKAKAWVEENTDPDSRTMWVESLVVEHRFAIDVARGMQSAGLSIGVGMDAAGGRSSVPC